MAEHIVKLVSVININIVFIVEKEMTLKPGTTKRWDWDSLVEHVMVHYRWVFVIFLLPISFLFDLWFYTRNKIIFALNSAPTAHTKKVKDVQKQVREYHDSGSRVGMCTARPGKNVCFPSDGCVSVCVCVCVSLCLKISSIISTIVSTCSPLKILCLS